MQPFKFRPMEWPAPPSYQTQVQVLINPMAHQYFEGHRLRATSGGHRASPDLGKTWFRFPGELEAVKFLRLCSTPNNEEVEVVRVY